MRGFEPHSWQSVYGGAGLHGSINRSVDAATGARLSRLSAMSGGPLSFSPVARDLCVVPSLFPNIATRLGVYPLLGAVHCQAWRLLKLAPEQLTPKRLGAVNPETFVDMIQTRDLNV